MPCVEMLAVAEAAADRAANSLLSAGTPAFFLIAGELGGEAIKPTFTSKSPDTSDFLLRDETSGRHRGYPASAVNSEDCGVNTDTHLVQGIGIGKIDTVLGDSEPVLKG